MGYGLEEPDPDDEDLHHALVLSALGHRITWREYDEEMPQAVWRALLDLKAGQGARNAGEARAQAAFGQIITTPPEG